MCEHMYSYNSMHVCVEAHKNIYVLTYEYKSWDFVITTNVLGQDKYNEYVDTWYEGIISHISTWEPDT